MSDDMRKIIREVIDEGIEKGEIEIVGVNDHGNPVYMLTEKGRDKLALMEEFDED